MTEIFESNNHILILSGYDDPNMHAHSASHIMISQYPFQLFSSQSAYTCYGALIPGNIPHTVKTNGKPMLVFMFDETTSVSDEIRSLTILQKEKTDSVVRLFRSVQLDPDNVEMYHSFMDDTLRILGFHSYATRIKDARIQEAVQYINANCTKELTCKDIASIVSLSESRFSHLFHDETGITFASYLILRRLIYAYDLLSEHASITRAAIEAGFSDPSHFAYLNQKMFGLTASSVSQELIIHHMF